MTTDEIRQKLFALQDEPYRAFQAKLIPTVNPETIIGVRTPALRKLAKELTEELTEERTKEVSKEVSKEPGTGTFLQELPHRYFEENQLQAFIISLTKDYGICMELTERFLPFIDNWATCDQFSPKVFRKHRQDLLRHILIWIRSDKTYTVRFGIGMLMQHFLEEDFDPAYPELAAGVVSDEYYINMMIAWYFATALAKQYEAVLPYIEEKRLAPWTHNKTIQKALESFRITPEQKQYLRRLKVKPGTCR
ncbi:MAG: DNA alkylation repair protein [Eubacterium sp.]|nr:DNA alkylation repair protein [Eubacterium sp.]